mgnify:CR=1 FL=1
MKIHKYNQAMKHIARPPSQYTKAEKAEIVKGFYKNNEQPKRMPILSYISKMNSLYGNGEEIQKKTSTDQRTDSKQVKPDIKVKPKKDKWTYESWADGLEERTRPAKKAPVKIVKKPKPPIIDFLELQDWINEIDPQWWIEEEPEDKVLLRVPKRELKGLASLLKRG